eukprot:IDg17424t1
MFAHCARPQFSSPAVLLTCVCGVRPSEIADSVHSRHQRWNWLRANANAPQITGSCTFCSAVPRAHTCSGNVCGVHSCCMAQVKNILDIFFCFVSSRPLTCEYKEPRHFLHMLPPFNRATCCSVRRCRL